MPLEVVVEMQIRAISCPGVFLPDKQHVYLGVYLLNQYLETICFPPVFPIVIHQSARFEKVFENAVDPGAVADILESFLTRFELVQLVPPAWEELAYYEENTRDFLFPEPRLTSPYPGKYREILMKTAAGFPGIAPKLEFCTRTAIRECTSLPRNRFLKDRHKSQEQPPNTCLAPKFPVSNVTKLKESNVHRPPPGLQSPASSPYPARRLLQDQSAQPAVGNNTKVHRGRKPPFVVRHVDSAKPFGEDVPECHSWKSRRKADLSYFPSPVRRASSLDNLAAHVKVIKEPDERIVLRSNSPALYSPHKSGKSWPGYSSQGDTELHEESTLAASQLSRTPSPLLDQPPLQERFQSHSPSSCKKIHERVCNLLSSHRASKYTDKEEPFSDVNDEFEGSQYSLKKYPEHQQKYF